MVKFSKMTKDTLKKLSEKFMDLGNICAGTLSIGILISGKEFNIWFFLCGFVS